MPIRARSLPFIAWALAVGVVTVSRASAEAPCAADVRTFCSDVKGGGPRIATCLRENQAKLSAACREKLEADALRARKYVEEVGKACRSDVDRFCAGVEPGGGRVLGCLAQHRFELTSSCESEVSRIAEARERIANIRRACTADVESLCKDVPPEVGPILECLRANEERLSSGCNVADLRQAVDAGTLVDVVEEMASRDRVREALQIFQGLDSVAFSRSQILLQFDSYISQRSSEIGNRPRDRKSSWNCCMSNFSLFRCTGRLAVVSQRRPMAATVAPPGRPPTTTDPAP